MAAGGSARARRFDAGRVCLDLVATEGAGGARGPGELLGGADRLVRWLREVRLVPPDAELSAVDGEWVACFRELRAYVRFLMDAQLNGAAGPSDALDRLNALAAGPPPSPRAVRGADGSLVRTLSSAPDCAGLLAVVARDAVDLLTDPVARAALRRCQGETCHRLYLDTSRGRRRRWCSGGACGNRARVARHRRRSLEAPGGRAGSDSPGPPAGGGPETPAADRDPPAGGSPETPAADRDPPAGEAPGAPAGGAPPTPTGGDP
ncbi:CGNR zinc finger domain-containing protein [Streptomyces californicus]|uniref:CGNR zinc finger domain-containing protein n=1 Tax=Streptomyces californicus TaxID=67351 RepID=UPI0036DF2AC9